MTHRAFSLTVTGLAILLLGALAAMVVEQEQLSASLSNFLFSSVQPRNTRPVLKEAAEAGCTIPLQRCIHNCLRSVFGEEGSDQCLGLCTRANQRCERERLHPSPSPSPAPLL